MEIRVLCEVRSEGEETLINPNVTRQAMYEYV
jgi:hypothetical protein